ncbi:unnamed protein product, partial [marine sediment metagenome]
MGKRGDKKKKEGPKNIEDKIQCINKIPEYKLRLPVKYKTEIKYR